MRMARITAAGILLAALAMPVTAAAQSNNPLQSYYAFIANHPSAAAALQLDPSLYRNSNFMNQHPEVQAYLLQHPSQYQRLMSQAPRHSDENAIALNNFLKIHPGVARSLYANPAVSTDPTFLNQHPNFRRFLQTHPVEQRRLAARGQSFEQYGRGVSGAAADPGWRHDMDDDEGEQAYRHHGPDRHPIGESEGEDRDRYSQDRDHHDHGKHVGWYDHDHHDHGEHAGWHDHDNHGHGKNAGWYGQKPHGHGGNAGWHDHHGHHGGERDND